MAWNDRDYNNSRYDARSSPNPIMRILFGSVPIGTYFGTRVRVHSTLIFLIIFKILSAGRDGITVRDVIVGSVILFMSILLHEFGHIFGSRIMGGRGEDILMWPLGGLAFVEPVRKPWPSFVSTVCGPLVNLILCLISGTVIYFLSGGKHFPPLDPRIAFDYGPLMKNHLDFVYFYMANDVAYYFWWIFTVNWTLLIFNLCLVMFPFDMGRMIQETLWAIVGYRKSMLFASITGMVGCVLLAMFAIATMASGGTGLMLLMIAAFGFMNCLQVRQEVQAGVYDEPDGPDLSAATWNDSPKPRKIKHSKGWFSAARRRAKKEQAEQAEIDAILAKVHEKGLHSLSWREKRALKRATEKQRQRDLAEERL
jgi:Zn-dependent protease